MEIWQISGKNKFAQFFETRCIHCGCVAYFITKAGQSQGEGQGQEIWPQGQGQGQGLIHPCITPHESRNGHNAGTDVGKSRQWRKWKRPHVMGIGCWSYWQKIAVPTESLFPWPPNEYSILIWQTWPWRLRYDKLRIAFMALQVERRTSDREVAGSTSARAMLHARILVKLFTLVCRCHQTV